MSELKDKVELLKDIKDANDILENFDREKAIDFIKNQNTKDVAIAVYNSPINAGYVTFEDATPQQLYNNIAHLRDYLVLKGMK